MQKKEFSSNLSVAISLLCMLSLDDQHIVNDVYLQLFGLELRNVQRH